MEKYVTQKKNVQATVQGTGKTKQMTQIRPLWYVLNNQTFNNLCTFAKTFHNHIYECMNTTR